MTKEQLLKMYNLHQEISRIENTIFNKEFMEDWWIRFEQLRTYFKEVYKEFEDVEDNSLLERLESIVDNGLQEFNFDLLTDKDRKKLTKKMKRWWMKMWDDWIEIYSEDEYESLAIFKHEEKDYPYCIVKFKDVEEAIDYLLNKELWN